jgi:hypothetical protein
MKVGDSGKTLSVNLKGSREISDVVKRLKIGDSVAAKIIKSQGNEAVIDINGKRLRADFINGVPDKKTIQLILTDKSSLNVVFKLADKGSHDSVIRLLPSFSLLSDLESEKLSMHSLVKYITSGSPDLFELNLFLLGLRRGDKKNSGQEKLFHMLMQKGLSLSSFNYINYILSSDTPLPVIMYFLNNFTERKKFLAGEKDREEAEKKFLEILEQDDGGIIEKTIEIFLQKRGDDPVYSEFLLPLEDGFIKIDYIIYNKSFLCTIDLTFLGKIDIIIKDQGDVNEIFLFPEKDEAELMLSENQKSLIDLLELNNAKKAVIHVFNRKKIVDKLSLWASDFYTKSGFDVKV